MTIAADRADLEDQSYYTWTNFIRATKCIGRRTYKNTPAECSSYRHTYGVFFTNTFPTDRKLNRGREEGLLADQLLCVQSPPQTASMNSLRLSTPR
ncbi:hypothetical protein ACTXT7_013002 [Hymenolepis weldensis]